MIFVSVKVGVPQTVWVRHFLLAQVEGDATTCKIVQSPPPFSEVYRSVMCVSSVQCPNTTTSVHFQTTGAAHKTVDRKI